jgi:tRNA1Val (adenine37-N6)-methyltransferase
MSRRIAINDPVLGPLTDDLLTPSVRVYQRRKGHRFSSDDVVTAYVAHATRPDAERVLDLGCGLGSVLLLLAWSLPSAELAGIEAQAMSFALLERNVARSGFAARVQILHGDLRDPTLPERVRAPFDLITGTPPYFPATAALDAEDEQRAFARIEYRGGVEAYIVAARPLLSPTGSLVVCGDARSTERTTSAARAVGLYVRARTDVVARAGLLPLFSVWTLGFAQDPLAVTILTLREADGAPGPDAARLREFCGFEAKSS